MSLCEKSQLYMGERGRVNVSVRLNVCVCNVRVCVRERQLECEICIRCVFSVGNWLVRVMHRVHLIF